MKVSLIDISTRSVRPPTYPAVSPTASENRRDRIATAMPKSNVLRIAKVRSQKVSWPREVVPNGCAHDGGASRATT